MGHKAGALSSNPESGEAGIFWAVGRRTREAPRMQQVSRTRFSTDGLK